jgi:hypothetical protein
MIKQRRQENGVPCKLSKTTVIPNYMKQTIMQSERSTKREKEGKETEKKQ